MQKRNSLMKHLLYIITALTIFLSSCSNEYRIKDESISKRVELLFSLEVEDQNKITTTKSNEITSIDMFIFDEGDRFVSREKIDDITLSNGKYLFGSNIETTK